MIERIMKYDTGFDPDYQKIKEKIYLEIVLFLVEELLSSFH